MKKLAVFYCAYCNTEQFLNYKKSRKICGNKACAKERATEQRAKKKRLDGESNTTTSDELHDKILTLSVIDISESSSFTAYNSYRVKENICDIKKDTGYLILFGEKYLIDEEKSEQKKGYFVAKKTGSNWLVFMDGIARICSSSLSLKLGTAN